MSIKVNDILERGHIIEEDGLFMVENLETGEIHKLKQDFETRIMQGRLKMPARCKVITMKLTKKLQN